MKASESGERGGGMAKWTGGMVLFLLSCAACVACVEPRAFTPPAPSRPQPRLPQNNAYEGSVITGALRPTFVWEPSTAAGPAGAVDYELQYSPDASFASDTVTIQTRETRFQVEANLPVAMTPPVGRRYYWRVKACLEQSCSEHSPTWWVNLGRNRNDYNGDGFADLLIASLSSVDNVERVFMYAGGKGPFVKVPAATISLRSLPIGFGFDVDSAGDVNGDGFADIIVGAPYGRGAAYFYLGGPGALDTVPDAIFQGVFDGRTQFGWAVSAAGDVNGDGFDDFAIGAFADVTGGAGGVVYLSLGNANNVLRANYTFSGIVEDQLGRSLSAVGDVNGDGFGDLAVGALGLDNNGSVYLYLGGETPDSIADMRVPGNVPQDFYGATLAGGDFNRDGFSELVVGVPAYNASSVAGLARVYEGSPGLDPVPDVIFSGAVASEKLGAAAAVGDVNGDGMDDLALGATVSNGLGRAGTYVGHQNETLIVTASPALQGRASNDGYGGHVAIHDLNGDGFGDVIVGASVDATGGIGGRVYIHHGRVDGTFSSAPDSILEGPAGSSLGSEIE